MGLSHLTHDPWTPGKYFPCNSCKTRFFPKKKVAHKYNSTRKGHQLPPDTIKIRNGRSIFKKRPAGSPWCTNKFMPTSVSVNLINIGKRGSRMSRRINITSQYQRFNVYFACSVNGQNPTVGDSRRGCKKWGGVVALSWGTACRGYRICGVHRNHWQIFQPLQCKLHVCSFWRLYLCRLKFIFPLSNWRDEIPLKWPIKFMMRYKYKNNLWLFLVVLLMFFTFFT